MRCDAMARRCENQSNPIPLRLAWARESTKEASPPGRERRLTVCNAVQYCTVRLRYVRVRVPSFSFSFSFSTWSWNSGRRGPAYGSSNRE